MNAVTPLVVGDTGIALNARMACSRFVTSACSLALVNSGMVVVFKSNGLAAWDVALGAEAARRARRLGVGTQL